MDLVVDILTPPVLWIWQRAAEAPAWFWAVPVVGLLAGAWAARRNARHAGDD